MLPQFNITYPDRHSEQVTMAQPLLRIGRGLENDLVLNDERVSRFHAELRNDERGLEIVDLGSALGIRVDGFQPLQQATLLTVGSIITIGAHQITFIGMVAPAASTAKPTALAEPEMTTPAPLAELPAVPAASDDGAHPAIEPPVPAMPTPSLESAEQPAAEQPAAEQPAAEQASPQVQQITIQPLSKADYAVEPGTTSHIPVRVENQSDHTLALTVTLTGIPDSWWSVAISDQRYNPREVGEFDLALHPPKHATSRAGRYPCQIVARSTQPVFAATQPMTLTVTPFVAFVPVLRPKKVRGLFRARTTLAIENQSNIPLDLALTGNDDEDVLTFRFGGDAPQLEPGQRTTMPVRMRSRRGGWFGRASEYRFDILVTPEQAPNDQRTLPGTGVINRLSVWLLILPLMLLLLLLPLLYRNTILDLLTPQDTRQVTQVQYGLIASGVTASGAVVPSNQAQLAFQRDGVIQTLVVKAGDTVRTGMILGELRPLEQLRIVRAAEDAYAQAERELAAARQQQQRNVALAKLDVAQAQENAQQVMPGGADDPARQLQQGLTEAQRSQSEVVDAASEAKTSAQAAMLKAASTLQEAQQRYSTANWKYTWVQQYGTDPGESPTTESVSAVNGNKETETSRTTTAPAPLNEVQKQAFKDAVDSAKREMDEADRALEASKRAYEAARTKEVAAVQRAQDTTADAQRQVDTLVEGQNNPTLSAANRATKAAQIKLEAATTADLEPYLKAIEEARQKLEAERAKLPLGQIVAPRDGIVVQVTKIASDTVTTQMPIVTLALSDSALLPLEVAATVSDEQIAAVGLRLNSPVAIALLSEQPVTITGRLRRFPSMSSNGQPADQSTRFAFDTQQMPPLTLDTAARVVFSSPAAQRKVYYLAPPFIRSDGTNAYIIVRAKQAFGWLDLFRGKYAHDRRIDVMIGQRTASQVEIVQTFNDTETLIHLCQSQAQIMAPDTNQP